MTNYKFIKYQSLYDADTILFALEGDGVVKLIDDVKFIEVTPDFKQAQFVRADSLKSVGFVMKGF